jgi:hypothetical protein
MRYDFKMLPELGWAVFIAVVVQVGFALLDITETTDLRGWAMTLAAASARAAGGAIVTFITRSRASAV